ncbi:Uncharacterised protein [Mycobacteroides abscessus subsp. abscessus]|nr:Uncharacterised protein [Mycobacteroides abscessus subsp. abscessus]
MLGATRPASTSPASQRCGHFTTSSSASGKRSGVAKTGRASQTVTR